MGPGEWLLWEQWGGEGRAPPRGLSGDCRDHPGNGAEDSLQNSVLHTYVTRTARILYRYTAYALCLHSVRYTYIIFALHGH
jgi:hypothetical protein